MMEHFTVTNLVALIIGVTGSIIGYVIITYWSNHRTKSINRRIEAAKARMNQLESLAKSERAVQLLSLRALFSILGFMSLTFSIEATDTARLALWRENFFDVYAVTRGFCWVSITFAAFYMANLLGQVSDLPESTEKIKAKIAKLVGKKPKE